MGAIIFAVTFLVVLSGFAWWSWDFHRDYRKSVYGPNFRRDQYGDNWPL